MNVELYRALRSWYAPTSIPDTLLEQAFKVKGGGAKIPDVYRAVYIVTDQVGRVVYVGKTRRRRGNSVRDRIREHLRDSRKSDTWEDVWIIALRDSSSEDDLLLVEGHVGRHLLGGRGGRHPSIA